MKLCSVALLCVHCEPSLLYFCLRDLALNSKKILYLRFEPRSSEFPKLLMAIQIITTLGIGHTGMFITDWVLDLEVLGGYLYNRWVCAIVKHWH